MTPQELVVAAQQGDRDAFGQLWNLYRAEVQRYVYRRTTDHHVAEDITSEAFLRAWARIGSFTWEGKGFPGWVITIARNLVVDHYKSTYQRHTYLDGDSAEWRDPDTDRRNDPINAVVHAELAAALDVAVAQLLPGQREVILHRFGVADRSLAATADATGRPVTAVKMAQHRATTALRRHPAITALEVAA